MIGLPSLSTGVSKVYSHYVPASHSIPGRILLIYAVEPLPADEGKYGALLMKTPSVIFSTKLYDVLPEGSTMSTVIG